MSPLDLFADRTPEEVARLREALRGRPRGTDPTPGGLAGVPVQSANLRSVRAVGGFVQTSARFIGKGV